jgi:hypothetical protein
MERETEKGRTISSTHCSFAYSALASFRMEMSGSGREGESRKLQI